MADSDERYGKTLHVYPPKPNPMSEHTAPTPPPDLRAKWAREAFQEGANNSPGRAAAYVAVQAAQWGWDQKAAATEAELQKARDEELKGCEEWVADNISVPEAADLRIARRPKPPSLRKQAYDALDTYVYGSPDPKDKERTYNTIRQALEALPND